MVLSALIIIASRLKNGVKLIPHTLMGSIPENVKAIWVKVWNAWAPAQKIMISRSEYIAILSLLKNIDQK